MKGINGGKSLKGLRTVRDRRAFNCQSFVSSKSMESTIALVPQNMGEHQSDLYCPMFGSCPNFRPLGTVPSLLYLLKGRSPLCFFIFSDSI